MDGIEDAIIAYLSAYTGLTTISMFPSAGLNDLPQEEIYIVVSVMAVEQVAEALFKCNTQIDFVCPISTMDTDLVDNYRTAIPILVEAVQKMNPTSAGSYFTAEGVDYRGQWLSGTDRSIENGNHVYQINLTVGAAT